MTSSIAAPAAAKIERLRRLSERDWQSLVVDAAKLFGWTTFHVLHSRGMERGWPDLVALRAGEAIFAELKTEDGKVTAAQGTVLAQLEEAGFEVHVWRPSSEREVLDRLSAPRVAARKPVELHAGAGLNPEWVKRRLAMEPGR